MEDAIQGKTATIQGKTQADRFIERHLHTMFETDRFSQRQKKKKNF